MRPSPNAGYFLMPRKLDVCRWILTGNGRLTTSPASMAPYPAIAMARFRLLFEISTLSGAHSQILNCCRLMEESDTAVMIRRVPVTVRMEADGSGTSEKSRMLRTFSLNHSISKRSNECDAVTPENLYAENLISRSLTNDRADSWFTPERFPLRCPFVSVSRISIRGGASENAVLSTTGSCTRG